MKDWREELKQKYLEYCWHNKDKEGHPVTYSEWMNLTYANLLYEKEELEEAKTIADKKTPR